MPTSNWSRSDNFFQTVTNRSYIGAKGIFTSLDTKLQSGIADPDILAFYNTFHPLNIDYNTDYAFWNGLRSTGIGKTLGSGAVDRPIVIHQNKGLGCCHTSGL